MKFELGRTVELLRQTPYTLSRMLEGLSPEWTQGAGDIEDWAPYDIIGHLIHGEETDWMPRAEIILAQGANRSFEPYDRTAQFKKPKGAPLTALLTEFAHIRNANIERLVAWELQPEHFELSGTHPASVKSRSHNSSRRGRFPTLRIFNRSFAIWRLSIRMRLVPGKNTYRF